MKMVLAGGGSAAVVLGKDLRTVSHMDCNDIGLAEVNCLNLAKDHAIWPHYEPRHDKLIEEFIQKRQQPVLAIPERSGMIVESTRMYAVGFEPAYHFDNEGKSEVQGRSPENSDT